MIIHPIKYNRTINKQLRMKNRFASHRDRHPLGEEGTCHLEDASIRDTNDEKAADEFTTYHVVACGYHAANKKELMYGCSIIRSSTAPSLLFRRPRQYVTILNSASTQQGPTQGELYRLMKMHLTFAIRIFCIWSTCTVPKAVGDIIELQLTLAGRNNLYRSGCSLILYILRLPGRLKLSIRYRVFASLCCLTIARSHRQKFDNVIGQLNKKLYFSFIFFFFLKSTDRIFSTISVRTYIAKYVQKQKAKDQAERCQCHRYI